MTEQQLMTLRKIIKKSFLNAGLDIKKASPATFKEFVWLKNLNIETIFDIGANTGQFATMLSEVLPKASMYSFEPLGDCFEKLLLNMKNHPRFRAFNFALGDRDYETEIYRSKHSPSSSILPMKDLHKKVVPQSDLEAIEKIAVKRLDGITDDLDCKENILVKLDVQGYEDRVICGGKKLISKAKVLIIETSFQSLYEGQPLFDDIYNMIRQMNFLYMGDLGQLKSPIDGSSIQADSIFLRGKKT